MKTHNITTQAALANVIGTPSTTLASFLSNLQSRSTAKAAFCNYFNITVEQLENERLADSGIWDNRTCTQEKPILETSEDELYKELRRPSTESVLKQLKNAIAQKGSLRYKAAVVMARKELKNLGDPTKALDFLYSVWWVATPNDLNVVCKSDLKLYIDLCKQLNETSGIDSLVEKLISKKFFNPKFVTILGIMLESDYPDFAQTCFEMVAFKEDEV